MLIHRLRTVAVALVFACFAAPALTGCQTNPATGQSNLNMLSQSEEIEIGSEAEPKFLEQYGGEVPDPQLQAYVSNLGQRLAAASERPDLPWKFHVVDSSVINAFALPGGKIFITRGLLSRMNNEAELAGVLGHEIGHVTAQHIGQQMTQAMILQSGIAILGAAAGEDYQWAAVLGGVGGNLYLLSYGRGQETQADELGTRYMTQLNYDPRGLLGIMNILAEAMGEGRQPEFLSTHPHPETRISNLNSMLKGDLAYTQNNPKYVLNASSFQSNALARLKQLPAPSHSPKSARDYETLRDAHAWLDDQWDHHHHHDHSPIPDRPIILVR